MFHEPFVVFGYLAALAPELELVTGVIILPQRQTALVAKQAAEVDILTGGKLRLGVGIGWNAVEYEGLGMDFHNRGRRARRADRRHASAVDRADRHLRRPVHSITAAGLNPLPVQRPIPIWIGASAEAAIKRAAETADGYFPQRPLEGGWRATMDKIHGWLEAAGRDPAKFGIDAAHQRWPVAHPTIGARQAEEWRALGATHLSVNTMGGGLQGPDAHVERLEQVARGAHLLRNNWPISPATRYTRRSPPACRASSTPPQDAHGGQQSWNGATTVGHGDHRTATGPAATARHRPKKPQDQARGQQQGGQVGHRRHDSAGPARRRAAIGGATRAASAPCRLRQKPAAGAPKTKPPRAPRPRHRPSLALAWVIAVMPLKNWLTNQNASTSMAGRSNVQKKNSTGISTRTQAAGYAMKYAPSTPAIAPLAPISGRLSPDEIQHCTSPATAPASK